MSPEQVRAARNWLAWSQAELADRAGIGISTVSDYERGLRTPIQNNLGAMQRALESAGISFIHEGIKGPITSTK